VSVGERAIETMLYDLPDVIAARADLDGGRNRLSVVVTPDADPADLASRVFESLASDGHDDGVTVVVTPLGQPDASVTVDREDADEPAPSRSPEVPSSRLHLDSVIGIARRGGVSYEVTLRLGDDRFSGSASGSPLATASVRLVAEATVRAVGATAPTLPQVYVERAEILPGSVPVAFVLLGTAMEGVEDRVTGSAVVRGPGMADAMARAVLDALNRRVIRPVAG
jgi:hypothetical protein